MLQFFFEYPWESTISFLGPRLASAICHFLGGEHSSWRHWKCARQPPLTQSFEAHPPDLRTPVERAKAADLQLKRQVTRNRSLPQKPRFCSAPAECSCKPKFSSRIRLEINSGNGSMNQLEHDGNLLHFSHVSASCFSACGNANLDLAESSPFGNL